ncbi:MAG: hypothetical protein RBS56_00610 [Candidatus Gracilibacteria bacterium]|nr:hypothetical protein [Candidatus Gracilibacteria bacterium]
MINPQLSQIEGGGHMIIIAKNPITIVNIPINVKINAVSVSLFCLDLSLDKAQ